jgi:hypothetical protein
MHRHARHWTAYAWIAVLAILFNALAPVVSHAMSRSTDAADGEICTTMGVAMKPMTMPGKRDSNALLKNLTDCGYCGTHAGSFGLPPTAGLALALVDTHDSHPYLFYQAPHPLAAWTAPQSRGPPAFA